MLQELFLGGNGLYTRHVNCLWKVRAHLSFSISDAQVDNYCDYCFRRWSLVIQSYASLDWEATSLTLCGCCWRYVCSLYTEFARFISNSWELWYSVLTRHLVAEDKRSDKTAPKWTTNNVPIGEPNPWLTSPPVEEGRIFNHSLNVVDSAVIGSSLSWTTPIPLWLDWVVCYTGYVQLRQITDTTQLDNTTCHKDTSTHRHIHHA